MDPRTLRRGAVRGAFPVGDVVISLVSPRKASWISYNSVLVTGIRVIVSGQLKMMSTGGKPR